MRIYLVGYMGSGKSYLGKRLAADFSFSFLDTDAMVEAAEGKSVVDVFRDAGEADFRRLETAALERTFSMQDVFVATGGGLPCHADNMERMNRNGITVYLDVRPEILAERLKDELEQRPLLNGLTYRALQERIVKQLSEREPFYRQAQVIFPSGEISAQELREAIRRTAGQSR